ncbi:MAG TPA: hypothetical protein VHK66_07880 [Microvirga sp.]|nr:hypothetical protein [Microvirga sp.]
MPTLKKRTLGALGGAAALLLASDPVGAQGFLQALFGPPQPPRGARSYAFPFPFVQPFFRPYREPARRAKPKPNVPADAAPAMPTEAKPARLTPDAELVANFMKDSTLRRGDIVVFPDGPRVFKGTAGSSTHRASDFEDLHATHLVGRTTRSAVLTATRSANGPPGAAPERQARPSGRGPDGATETGALAISATGP